jgi:hypothetical protein
MDAEQDLADSPRSVHLADRFRDKRYRDRYVASHTRRFLARQMRKLRGDRSQTDFGDVLGKRQTVVSRLENPAYNGWSVRTMLEIAEKLNLAVFARFVDFPTFLRLTKDMSDAAGRPLEYNQDAIDAVADDDQKIAERGGNSADQVSGQMAAQEDPDSCVVVASALAAFSSMPEQKVPARTARNDNLSAAPLMRRGGVRDTPDDISAAQSALQHAA